MTSNSLPMLSFSAGDDDCYVMFNEARWMHFPISEPSVWWKFLPLKWKVTTPEFGAKRRGMVNRIPKETWEGAHNR